MYEPAEDSELLQTVIRKYARGRVLDMGVGSGVLANTAQSMGLDVLGVDVDRKIVEAHKKSSYRVIYSDKFSNVKGKFDTIVCNPPYLPDDEIRDLALHGGKKGWEYIVNIIVEAKNHLTASGQLLFLISTLTKPAFVERALRVNGYQFSIVERKKLFMEELFVYRATLLLGLPSELIGQGKRSQVYATDEGAVKISSYTRAAKEAQLLKIVNRKGIGPKFRRLDGAHIIMEKISGEPFDKYVKRTNDHSVIRSLLNQARTLDTIGLNKQELTRPNKNILVTKTKKVVLLDFERSLFSQKPRNVTQIATWISRLLNKSCVSELGDYKRKPTAANFQAVVKKLGF